MSFFIRSDGFWQFHGNFGKRNRDFLSARYCPAFEGQFGRKYKFHLKSLNIGLLASY